MVSAPSWAQPEGFVDEATGLRWGSASSTGPMSWYYAKSYCREEQGTGWRLPTVGELETLVKNGALRAPFGEGLPDDAHFFSGERVLTIQADTDRPYIMRVATGHVFDGDGYEAHVRCVYGKLTRVMRVPAYRAGWWDRGTAACPEGTSLSGYRWQWVACLDTEGQKHGMHTEWDDRLRTDTTYQNGALEGPLESWWTSGGRAGSGWYRNGEQVGLWREWNEDGNLSSKCWYTEGVLNTCVYFGSDGPYEGMIEFSYTDGSIGWRGRFRQGRKVGVSRRWAEDGQLMSVESWQNGQLHGPRSVRLDNGHVRHEHYVRGRLHGVSITYDARGRKKDSQRYEYGVAVNKTASPEEKNEP